MSTINETDPNVPLSVKKLTTADIENIKSIDEIKSGVKNAILTDSPIASIDTYQFSQAGTATNFGGIVITTGDLAGGIVQIRRQITGSWIKVIIPIDLDINRRLSISNVVCKDFLINEYVFEQGDFNTGGADDVGYAVRSKYWYTLDVDGILSLTVDVGFRVYLISSNDLVTFNRVFNDNNTDFFADTAISKPITDRYLRVVVTRTDFTFINTEALKTIQPKIIQADFASKNDVNNVLKRVSDALILSKDFILNEYVFEQGDFNTNGEESASYAIRSKYWYTLDVLGALTISVGAGYRIYLISSNNFGTFNRVFNVNGQTHFEGDAKTKSITDRYLRIVIARTDLSSINITAFAGIGVAIKQAPFSSQIDLNDTKPFELIPRFSSAVEKKLMTVQMQVVKGARRLFTDRTGYFYQAGLSYNGLFLFDTILPIMALPEVFDYKSVYKIIQKFIDKADPLTGMFPMAINSDNTVHAYYSGADEKRVRPCGETTFWMPVIIEWLFDKSDNYDFILQNLSKLSVAMDAIPRNLSNGLVKVIVNDEWVPWGFQETARFTGDVLNGSVFYWMGASSLSRLYSKIGDTANATKYLTIANQIKTSLGTSSELWSAASGMFFAATGQNKQISVWISALAVSCGLVTGAQATAISTYIVTNYNALTHKGYIRPSNVNWSITGHLLADNSYGAAYTPGFYQDGYWSVANKWVLDAIALTNQSKAVEYASDILETPNFTMERWDNIGGTPTVSGNYGMIVSPSGTLEFVRNHNWLF